MTTCPHCGSKNLTRSTGHLGCLDCKRWADATYGSCTHCAMRATERKLPGEMKGELSKLVAKYGAERVLRVLYDALWWDDCTPSGTEAEHIAELFEEEAT